LQVEVFMLVLAAYILFLNNNTMDAGTDVVLSILFIGEQTAHFRHRFWSLLRLSVRDWLRCVSCCLARQPVDVFHILAGGLNTLCSVQA
jgi:hypothetical protein